VQFIRGINYDQFLYVFLRTSKYLRNETTSSQEWGEGRIKENDGGSEFNCGIL
jgi:hypothetical protein